MFPRAARRVHLSVTAVVLSIVLLFTGCTTFHSVPFPPEGTQRIALHVGDHVRVHRHDGSRVEFRIEQIQGDALAGQGSVVKYADIRQVEVKRIHRGRTALTAAGVVIGVIVLTGVVILLTGDFVVMPSGPS